MTTRNIRSACIGHGTHHLLEDIADRYDTVQAMEHTPYDVVVLDLPQNQEAQALGVSVFLWARRFNNFIPEPA
jgi:tRNA A58 N-methylase Trm61